MATARPLRRAAERAAVTGLAAALALAAGPPAGGTAVSPPPLPPLPEISADVTASVPGPALGSALEPVLGDGTGALAPFSPEGSAAVFPEGSAAVFPGEPATALAGESAAVQADPADPAAPAGPSASERPPGRAGPYVFRDEFTGPAGRGPGASKWKQETGCMWGHGAEDQCYTGKGRNARLDGAGHLVITARSEKHVGTDGVARSYTSARLVSTSAWKGGTLEVRAKMSRWQAGAWPAIWLLGRPAARTPYYGEIDLMENGFTGRRWNPQYHVHTDGAGSGAGGEYGIDATRWHVYKVRWTTGPSGRVWFYLDGRLMRVLPYRVPSGSPAEVILNIAVGSRVGTPAAKLDSTLTVDYVRVRR
ncbi:glycoside hydrolase family 16 protein [Planomonospora corallina]|uniref:Glycoside hydrolase family 16 protein n=1 Tax=Planomonospora corallina TaxID=1806052 RepID=A0ABV8I6R7_9ACTN